MNNRSGFGNNYPYEPLGGVGGNDLSGSYGAQYQPNPYPKAPGTNPYNDPGNVNNLLKEKKSYHCQAIVATIFLVGGIVLAVILLMNKSIGIGGLIGIIVAAYLLYLLIGCCCNSLNEYLGNVERGENFHNYYEMGRTASGQFHFTVECYHYETRYRHDSTGGHTEQVKVTTHTAQQTLRPRYVKDESGVMPPINPDSNMIFVDFLTHYKFIDSQSQMAFDNYYRNFKAHNTRDSHQDFNVEFKIDGLVQKKTFYVGELDSDLYTKYYCWGCLGCLLPYSCWVQSKVSRYSVDMMKVVQL